MIWYVKAGIFVFTALILVPYIYRKIRSDEPVILEGGYHVEVSHESRKYGEYDPSELPPGDMPFHGTSISNPGRYLGFEIGKVWLPPDVQRYRAALKKKAEKEE